MRNVSLRIVLGIIAILAAVWFISSFFFLQDENPRSSMAAPSAVTYSASAALSPSAEARSSSHS